VKRYEYLIEALVSNDAAKEMNSVARALTALGKNGWELVTVVPIENYHGESSLFYFKREKPN
jgi:hypothetical protein